MLYTILAFVVALGLIITFHELGHYWVARWCGVKVLRFSVGFGQVLWQRTDKHGTEWALSAIPLGGYVKMQDEAPEQATPAEAAQAFTSKSVYQRFAIVVAGPLANLLLAVVLYALLAFVGTPAPAPLIGQPPPGTPAAQAGFQAKDRILAIDDKAVQSWAEVNWQLIDRLATGGELAITVETPGGQTSKRYLQLRPVSFEPIEGDPLESTGLLLDTPQPFIKEVLPGSAAEKAGLRVGDQLMAIDQIEAPSASALVDYLANKAQQPVSLTTLREGTELRLSIVPDSVTEPDGTTIGRIGVLLGAELPMVTVHHGVGGSVLQGFVRTGDTMWFSLKMMGRMLVGDVSVRNISGPVTIADYAGQTARMGMLAYVGFLALVSVSIGVLNLLPIPMLDGGHLMYYLIEIVRGKPLSQRFIEAGQRIGLALLASLMGLAFLNDFSRLFS